PDILAHRIRPDHHLDAVVAQFRRDLERRRRAQGPDRRGRQAYRHIPRSATVSGCFRQRHAPCHRRLPVHEQERGRRNRHDQTDEHGKHRGLGVLSATHLANDPDEAHDRDQRGDQRRGRELVPQPTESEPDPGPRDDTDRQLSGQQQPLTTRGAVVFGGVEQRVRFRVVLVLVVLPDQPIVIPVPHAVIVVVVRVVGVLLVVLVVVVLVVVVLVVVVVMLVVVVAGVSLVAVHIVIDIAVIDIL